MHAAFVRATFKTGWPPYKSHEFT